MASLTDLFSELRRRSVIRVGLAYVVSAWILVQVAEIAAGAFGAPAWVLQLLIALLVVGLVPTIIFAWVYELTPEGLRRDTADGTARDGTAAAGTAGARNVDSHAHAARTVRRLDIVVIGLLVVAIGLFVADRGMPGAGGIGAAQDGARAGAAPARSIAVLAFVDMSPERDQEYFADGISEELLNVLAMIPELRVAARTSSFHYKGQNLPVAEIGAALGVETVLEGSVRKAGDQVRITAQLINASDGFHLWSSTYDRPLENIFAVQDDIASAIAEALRLQFDLAPVVAGRTTNVEAHDLYLRGRQFARAPVKADLLRAIELYEEALALDPSFAAAYSGIAEAWIWLEDYGGIRGVEAFPQAERAARRALAIDESIPEALAATALVRMRSHNDPVGAQVDFERALRVNPNYVEAYNLYGDVLRILGDYRRMIEVHRRAVELDPLSVFYRSRLASKLMQAGRSDESREIIDAILAEDPDNDYALEELANLLGRERRFAESARAYRRVHDSRPGDPYPAYNIALIGAYVSDDALAREWIAAARDRGADNRWELAARATLADWRGDWPALREVGSILGGHEGAYLRGWALAMEDRLPEARRAFAESLRLGGYEEGSRVVGHQVQAITALAWLDRLDGLPSWETRLLDARRFLDAVAAQGGTRFGAAADVDYQLAVVAAISDDRSSALTHLRGAIRNGFPLHWFLDRDRMFAEWREDPEFRAIVEDMRAHAAREREKL